MFDDDMRAALKKMHEFSAADGFVEITEGVGDTIRYVANEPSMGLFFVQQHTKNAAPNLVKLKNKISGKSHVTTLHTQDLCDSTAMVKSMKECGSPIVGEMMKDIRKSLQIISAKQSKIGLNENNGGEMMVNYMSSMLSSAKEKATSFKWSPFDLNKWEQSKGDRDVNYSNSLRFKGDELPVSSPSDELEGEESSTSSSHKWIPLLEKSYDDFRASSEAKLEDWLEAGGIRGNNNGF